MAYRVVQEALTNALKYDHGGRTSVLVRHGEREITVEVGTDGSGTGPGPRRKRAGAGRSAGAGRVLGGEFSADPVEGGGFVVRARIPGGGGGSTS